LPSWDIARQFTSTLTTTNLIVIALNLLPVRPFDGAEAWQLFRR
jgi:Zn-dependent protease